MFYKINGFFFWIIQKCLILLARFYLKNHFFNFVNNYQPKIYLIMKPTSIMEFITPEAVQNFARKNYKIYVAHCETRKLKPMQLTEFLKNYVI